VWLKKPFMASFWGGRATEDWILTQVYHSAANWNETHWNNETFDKILAEARSELDQAKRREMYVELQKLIHFDGGTVIPLFSPYVQAASKKVALPTQMAQNAELDGNRCAERWWFV
jgi:peptide/nickel transport system substrate-binding protein